MRGGAGSQTDRTAVSSAANREANVMLTQASVQTLWSFDGTQTQHLLNEVMFSVTSSSLTHSTSKHFFKLKKIHSYKGEEIENLIGWNQNWCKLQFEYKQTPNETDNQSINQSLWCVSWTAGTNIRRLFVSCDGEDDSITAREEETPDAADIISDVTHIQ